jgi:hypothetical protein
MSIDSEQEQVRCLLVELNAVADIFNGYERRFVRELLAQASDVTPRQMAFVDTLWQRLEAAKRYCRVCPNEPISFGHPFGRTSLPD